MIVDLGDKLNPKHCAVIIIDVQNDFCSPGGYMDREGQPLDMINEMLPNIQRLLAAAERANVPRIFFQANYGTPFNWYLSPAWLDRARRVNSEGGHVDYSVCEEGSWGFDIVDVVKPKGADDEIVLKKHRYSGFVNTELDLILRSRGIKTVVVTGVATNVCVESTARDAFVRDYFVVMPSDCCATYSDQEQEATLVNIRRYFGQVVTVSEVLKAWRVREAVEGAA